MNDTPNLALPYILAAQAQKHVTHNEAIRALDCLVQLAVISRVLTSPPASPDNGDRYIVASGATGGWTGKAANIAAYQDGAWMFYAPKAGWRAWIESESTLLVYDAGAWSAISSEGGEGGDPPDELDNLNHIGINTTADATNRLALKSAASLFDNDGAGHQHKINKKTAGDTASVLYQTNYSGRAETGLTGDDDFHFKVSPNGTNWNEAIKIDRTTGRVDFPNTGIVISRNRIINPSGAISQAGLAATSDGAYTGFDQWYALTQTDTITPSQLTDVADGVPFMMRLTQSQAMAQRFGIAQPLEAAFVKDLRSKNVALSAKVRASAATNLRFAIIEWTGTADIITKDIVASWTNGTYTAGQFFASSNLTIAATGIASLSANVLTDVTLAATLSASLNNVIVFFWTNAVQAQNVTVDIGNVWFGQGPRAPAAFDPPAPDADLRACMRYYQSIDTNTGTYVKANGFFWSATSARTLAPSAAPMHATPTFSVPSGSWANTLIRRYDGGTALTISSVSVATASAGVTTSGIGLNWTLASGGTPGNMCFLTSSENFIFDARI